MSSDIEVPGAEKAYSEKLWLMRNVGTTLSDGDGVQINPLHKINATSLQIQCSVNRSWQHPPDLPFCGERD